MTREHEQQRAAGRDQPRQSGTDGGAWRPADFKGETLISACSPCPNISAGSDAEAGEGLVGGGVRQTAISSP